MKKITIFIFCASISAYAQIGINKENPSAMLDIVGAGNTNATKALEVNNADATELFTVLDNGNVGIGVSSPTSKLHTNGSVNMTGLGTNTTNTKIMTTDASGNVTTRETNTLLPKVLAGCNGVDAVVVSRTISSLNDNLVYTTDLVVKVFTISQKSMVTLSYNLSANTLQTSGGASVTDGLSKLIGASLWWRSLPAGSPHTLGIFSRTAISFSNLGSTYVNGAFNPTDNVSIVLDPGTYSVGLVGLVHAADNGQGIRATFGAGSWDRFDVYATPVQ